MLFHGCWGASSSTPATFSPRLYAVSTSRNPKERKGGPNNQQLTICLILYLLLPDETLESQPASPFLRYSTSCSSWPLLRIYGCTLPSFLIEISFHGVRIGFPTPKPSMAPVVDRGAVGIRAVTVGQTTGRRPHKVIQGM